MESKQFIEKIKIYALISFFLPLITINLCLVVFKFLGDFSFYPNYTWDEKIIKHTPQKEYEINNDGDSWSFTNCPKYEFKKYAINTDNEIVEIKSWVITGEIANISLGKYTCFIRLPLRVRQVIVACKLLPK